MAAVAIFLLRKEYKPPKGALNEKIQAHQLSLGGDKFAEFYVKKSAGKAPVWVQFFQNQISASKCKPFRKQALTSSVFTSKVRIAVG